MRKKIGAAYLKNNTCRFNVWAPFATTVQVVFKDKEELVNLEKDTIGYWKITIPEIDAGTLYKFRLNCEKEFSDPASRSQPEGVHSWSQVVNADSFAWNDQDWKGLSIEQMIIYELHVGTFSDKGTFDAVIDKLDHLKELGINSIEIMPISQFPGNRNWGYDGVYPFCVQRSYGGAEALRRMIDACHKKEIAVILDVVYNHMGPEGNYLAEYGPYFTNKYQTPWGSALNFDDKYSDEVRNFFFQNALMWLEEFHFDGLRLDAIHEIIDRGAKHFLKELRLEVDKLEQKTGRNYILIAESDLNDTRIIDTYEKGGFGLEAQWVDDFHHSLHTLITGEKEGYYKDFGKLEDVAKSYKQAYVYDGIFSEFRKRRVGSSPTQLSPSKFVVCIQNHDQVGNRMLGDRLTNLVSFENLKLAAGIMLTAPYVPMLFMGEEFAEDRPFQYFVSHGDLSLVKAVQEGRKREFQYFFQQHKEEFPDPQSEETFNRSKINWDFKSNSKQEIIFEYYKEMIRLRKKGAFDAFRNKNIHIEVDENCRLMTVFGEKNTRKVFAAFNFNSSRQKIDLPKDEGWRSLITSADKKWGGPGESPEHFKGKNQVELFPNSLIICES